MSESTAVALSEAREEIVQRLSAHFAADHLEVHELERRLDLAFAAQTREQLDFLVADLPAIPVSETEEVNTVAVDGSAAVADHETMVAVMSGTERKGSWTPPRQLNAFACMGAVEIDFREATFGEDVVNVRVGAIMGAVEILVPPGVRVETHGLAFMGGFEELHQTGVQPSAPLVKVHGFALMGAVEIKSRLPGESARQAKKRLRAERKRLARTRTDSSR